MHKTPGAFALRGFVNLAVRVGFEPTTHSSMKPSPVNAAFRAATLGASVPVVCTFVTAIASLENLAFGLG